MGENLLRSELAIHTQHLGCSGLKTLKKIGHEFPLANIGNLFRRQRLGILARLLGFRRIVGVHCLRALLAIHGDNVFPCDTFPVGHERVNLDRAIVKFVGWRHSLLKAHI